jgi:hypothetical protein
MKKVCNSDRYDVYAITSFDELEEIETDWRRLEREGKIQLNATYDLYLQVARNLKGVTGPFVLRVVDRSLGSMTGILVGRLSREYREYTIGYKKIARVPVRALTFIYGGIGLPEQDAELIDQISRYLSEQACRDTGSDLVSLYMIRTDHALFRSLERAAGDRSNHGSLQTYPHWILRMPASVEEFYQSRSTNFRRNRRYVLRRLQKNFTSIVIRKYSEVGQLPELYQYAYDVARKTYQRGLGAGFQDDPLTRSIFGLAAGKGMLLSYILFLDGRPAAFANGFIHNGQYCGHSVGYDPRFASYSIGFYLWLVILEDLIKEKTVRELDFGYGDALYKRELCNHQWDEAPLCIYGKHPRGMVLRLGDRLTFRTSTAFRTIARAWGMEEKLRKVWRTYLRNRGQPVRP